MGLVRSHQVYLIIYIVLWTEVTCLCCLWYHPLEKEEPQPGSLYTDHSFLFLSSLQALCGVVFEVPTLDGDKLRISTMQEIIKPNTVKRVQGYGLPHPKDTARKGDLLIAFDIKFPEKLTSSEKELLSDLLPN